MKKYILPILLTLSIYSCQSKTIVTEYSSIKYRYVDSSVPPKYHRSYTIELTGNKYTYTVNSYGDELITESKNVSKKTVSKIDHLIQELKGTRKAKHISKSGSSAEGLTIYSDSTELVDVYWNKNAPESLLKLCNALKEMVRKNTNEIGMVSQNVYFEKVEIKAYRESLGNYVLLTDSINLNPQLQAIYPAFTSYFSTKQLAEYYVIPGKENEYGEDYLDIVLVHKNDFKIRLENEIKKKKGEGFIDFVNNPSGKSGSLRYSKKDKKITDFFIWE